MGSTGTGTLGPATGPHAQDLRGSWKSAEADAVAWAASNETAWMGGVEAPQMSDGSLPSWSCSRTFWSLTTFRTLQLWTPRTKQGWQQLHTPGEAVPLLSVAPLLMEGPSQFR